MATNQELKNALDLYFSLGEINTLCFDLGLPYEDIRQDSKTNTITALIQYTERMSQTAPLTAYINKARPHANLDPAVSDAPPVVVPQPDSPNPQPTGRDTYIIQGDYYGGGQGNTTFNMTGNFTGAILNINSKLENVNQTIGSLPRADEEAKAALQELVSELQAMLQQIPPGKEEDAEAVAALTETLIETANKEKPNKQILQITGEGLKQAARNLAAVVPDVVKIAGAIVTAVLAL